METFGDLNEVENEPMLDRKRIAVDFEDWDGLDDNDMLGSAATLAAMHDLDVEEVLKNVIPTGEVRGNL
jgi:hypothetical protein